MAARFKIKIKLNWIDAENVKQQFKIYFSYTYISFTQQGSTPLTSKEIENIRFANQYKIFILKQISKSVNINMYFLPIFKAFILLQRYAKKSQNKMKTNKMKWDATSNFTRINIVTFEMMVLDFTQVCY